MNIGILLPGFSRHADDWAIPVQQNLVGQLTADHHVRVVALRYPHLRGRYQLHQADVYALGVGAWTQGYGRLRLWWDALHLVRRLHRERPFDVLHAMWADETGLIAAWAGRWLGIPSLVSIAGGELVSAPQANYGLQRSAFGRWTVGQALHGADRVVAASRYSQRLIAEAGYHVPPEKTHVIPLGVDTTVFQPAAHPGRPAHLIHAASLIPIKDQATLLRAVARLPDVTLEVVGDGPLRSSLEQLASTLGLDQRVQFSGALPHLHMPSAFHRAALHVLTSRHEGQGMVTFEAAACGLPTVSTAVGIVPDYADLGVSVPVGDDAALALAIQKMLAAPETRTQQAAAALRLVTERFTVAHTAAALTALYEALAHNR